MIVDLGINGKDHHDDVVLQLRRMDTGHDKDRAQERYRHLEGSASRTDTAFCCIQLANGCRLELGAALDASTKLLSRAGCLMKPRKPHHESITTPTTALSP